MDSIPQFINRKWAEISVEELGRVMLYVYEHPDEVKQKTRKAEEFVRQRFGLDLVGEQFSRLFKKL